MRTSFAFGTSGAFATGAPGWRRLVPCQIQAVTPAPPIHSKYSAATLIIPKENVARP
jgi:hypothetical protein